MKKHFIFALLLAASARAQQPVPPPPPPSDGSANVPASSVDLSKMPVPEADRKTTPELTDAEMKGRPVQISIIPLGAVPPPIVVKGEDGLGKETYRKPLEYAPAVYHVTTEKGSVRIIGSQNQMAPPTAVPRRSLLQFSYEIPADINAVAPTTSKDKDNKPPLQLIGEFPVAEDTTHLVLVLWKDPSEKMWTSPKFRAIDVSPAKVKPNEAIVLNASGRDLAIHRGDAPYKITPGFMGKVALPVNAKGEVPMVVAAAAGAGWQQLSHTVIGPGKEDRIFVLAWQAPQSPAQPAGVAFQAVAKRLPEAKPFQPAR